MLKLNAFHRLIVFFSDKIEIELYI